MPLASDNCQKSRAFAASSSGILLARATLDSQTRVLRRCEMSLFNARIGLCLLMVTEF